MSEQLTSWSDTATRAAIVDFVERVTAEGGPDYVPPAERIAVFDNDGTLWCEKPMPIEVGFILAARRDGGGGRARCATASRGRRPTSTTTHGSARPSPSTTTATTATLNVLMGGILQAFAGQNVEALRAAPRTRSCADGQHPTLGRAFHECGYLPMIELLRYLEANGFTNYIASGGDRDFMRPVTDEIYGIPVRARDRQLNALAYQRRRARRHAVFVRGSRGRLRRRARSKPVRIWSRIGRRPIVAGGNSNGDIPMLRYAGGQARPALRLLLLHDDAEREFDYTAGARDSRWSGRDRTAGRSSASRTTGPRYSAAASRGSGPRGTRSAARRGGGRA